MRISFSREDRGIELQRYMLDNLNGNAVRVTTSDTSPYRPGETFDVSIRQAEWGADPDGLIIREYDRATRQFTTMNQTVYADRVHVY
jgi:hypothetical protein